MRLLILLCILSTNTYGSAQTVTALCDLMGDVEKYSADSTMHKLAGETRNLDGSYNTNMIPARFPESSYRDLGSGGFFLEFRSYGTPKQMEKALKAIMDEIAYCYPDHIWQEDSVNTENYRRYFVVPGEDTRNNSGLRFTLSILHTEGDQSKIVLKF